MYCPEDGRHIPLPNEIMSSFTIEYPPCTWCGTTYMYDAEAGAYQVKERGAGRPKQNPMEAAQAKDTLNLHREYLRSKAPDTLVGNIVDAMEKRALLEGQCTYYMGTYVVARETLVTAGLTCERDPGYHGAPPNPRLRWVSFMGDEYEFVTRQEAIKILLAERS